MGDDYMSDKAQRIFDTLMEYDAIEGISYPIASIIRFFGDKNNENFEALTADEEKQVIQAFLKFAY